MQTAGMSMPQPYRSKGFSLAELLIALAVLAILAALAGPGLQRQLAAARIVTAVDAAMAQLHLARQTALATGRSVVVCPSRNSRDCAFGAADWISFLNTAPGATDHRSAGEPILQRWRVSSPLTVSGTRGYVLFLPELRAATTATFRFCHPAAPELTRSIVISQTGRARISRPTPANTVAASACP